MPVGRKALIYEQAKWEVYLELWVEGPRRLREWKAKWDRIPIMPLKAKKAW